MARSLLPPSASALERHLEGAMGLYPTDRELVIDTLWDPARCPSALLPWLAWALGVRQWDPSWSVTVQRQVTAASVDLHVTEGTPAALRTMLDSIGAVYTMQEKYGGHPYRVGLTIWNQGEIAISIPSLRGLIDDVIRLSVDWRLSAGTSAVDTLHVGVWCQVVTVARFGEGP